MSNIRYLTHLSSAPRLPNVSTSTTLRISYILLVLILITYAWELASMYWGFILFPIGILLAFFTYLFAYDHLYHLFSSETGSSPLLANKSTQEKMGVAAFLFICFLTIITNRIFTDFSDPITLKVLHKTRIHGAKESCDELTLQDGSKHCVQDTCWYAATVGDYVTLQPQLGLLGLRRKDIECQKLTPPSSGDTLKHAF